MYFWFIYLRKLSPLCRGVRSRGAQCAYAPPCFKTGGAYAPPESMPPLKFEIVCFCPSWKKLSGGADGADSMTPLVTFLLLIFSCIPKIHCYNPYLFLGKLNFSYQICVGFIFIYMKSLKWTFKVNPFFYVQNHLLNLCSNAVNSQ